MIEGTTDIILQLTLVLLKIALYMNFLFPIGIVFKHVSQGIIVINKIKFKKSIFTTFVNILFLFVLFAVYRDIYERNEPILLMFYVCVILPILLIYLLNQTKVIFKQRELVFIGIVPMIYLYKKVKKRQRETVEKIVEEWIQNDLKEAHTTNFKNLVDREITLGKGAIGTRENLIKEQGKSTSIDVSVPIVPIEIELIKKYEQSIHGFNGAQGFYIRSAENLLTVLIKYIEYVYDEKGIKLSRETILQELLAIDELLWVYELPLKVFLAVIKDIMLIDSKNHDFSVLDFLGDNAAQKTSHELKFILDQVEGVDNFVSEITPSFMNVEIWDESLKYKKQVKEDWRMR